MIPERTESCVGNKTNRHIIFLPCRTLYLCVNAEVSAALRSFASRVVACKTKVIDECGYSWI